ncbi:peptide synthetase [Salinivibrio sp. SS3]|uniref:condensation domain-containing protein n=1 Tax=Salinivibrio sp. SS3 TaxID=1895021 RepID=UPI000848273C|nr:condensation domain-containing protein [Salinivibrio sp. BNH]ODP99488.1 peptide synthetase [Salinivibrio sp. BNH]
MNDLTPMQAACWFGRETHSGFLDGVSAHLYIEFNTQSLDLHKLESAIQRLHQEHAILNLVLQTDGQAIVRDVSTRRTPVLEIEDLTGLCERERQSKLLQKRDQWTHQQLELRHGQVTRFSVSLVGENHVRLHIDSDMIAIDPSSFRLLMEDLAQFYLDSDAQFPVVPSFFEWHAALKSNPSYRKLSIRDRHWWQDHLDDIAPAPSLPFTTSISRTAQSHCLTNKLSLNDVESLERLARQHKITLSSLIMGTFSFTLGQFIQDSHFRLNVPTFWRAPVLEETERCVGDFANFVLLSLNTKRHRSLASLSLEISTQMAQLLEHSHYSGVDILRDLSRRRGNTQVAPVVFTAALDLPRGALFSERVTQTFGSMDWCISQGPQVALDAQAVRIHDGALINWDIRLDYLELHWVKEVFTFFMQSLKMLSKTPALFDRDYHALLDTIGQSISQNKNDNFNQCSNEEPLSKLQKAYLLGRTNQLPIGGVAMQEFREYTGHFCIRILRERLGSLVERHDSLRTYIDTQRLTQSVSKRALINLTEIDLRDMSTQAAYIYINRYRESYTHALFNLDRPPWNITVFQIHDENLVVFSRFDALILDGRAIATLMNELFIPTDFLSSKESYSETVCLEKEKLTNTLSRAQDKEYWRCKLENIKNPPQVPWLKPLNSIKSARFKRLSTCIDASTFRNFYKLSAKRGLFKNTAIMSIILEILSYWSKDNFIYTAIPVLPLYSGALENNSTFITVTWKHNKLKFINQAKKLQNDIHHGLQHLEFSGIDIARQLIETCNTNPILPIVITNGLSWPEVPESHTMYLENGLTQTPQVAIDIRFTKQNKDELVFDVDYVTDAVNSTIVMSLLESIKGAIQEIVSRKEFCFDIYKHSITEQDNSSNISISTSKDEEKSTQDKIMKVYLDVIGIQESSLINRDMNFMDIGLKPQHFKSIIIKLNNIFSVKMPAKDIIKCRNAREVEKLLNS